MDISECMVSRFSLNSMIANLYGPVGDSFKLNYLLLFFFFFWVGGGLLICLISLGQLEKCTLRVPFYVMP